MSRILIIAKLTMLENARKQIFHVVTLLTLTVVCASVLLSIFTLGMQVKILKDLCMSSILFCGGILAIALGSTALAGEIESRTCYPILARRITRAEFILGKYFGTLATILIGLAVIGAAFAVLLLARNALDGLMVLALAYVVLEIAVISAVAMCLSAVSTPAVSVMVTFLVYVLGTVKIGYFKPMIDGLSSPITRTLASGIYHILPNLESFNFKDALVHKLSVPNGYLIQVAIYGFCYSALVLTMAAWSFAKKEL